MSALLIFNQFAVNSSLKGFFVTLLRLLIWFAKGRDTCICCLDIKAFFGSAPYKEARVLKICLLPLQLGFISSFLVIDFYIFHIVGLHIVRLRDDVFSWTGTTLS